MTATEAMVLMMEDPMMVRMTAMRAVQQEEQAILPPVHLTMDRIKMAPVTVVAVAQLAVHPDEVRSAKRLLSRRSTML